MSNHLVPLFLAQGKAEPHDKENGGESCSQHGDQKGVEEGKTEERKDLVDNLIIEL